jgi:hypothetical protein
MDITSHNLFAIIMIDYLFDIFDLFWINLELKRVLPLNFSY